MLVGAGPPGPIRNPAPVAPELELGRDPEPMFGHGFEPGEPEEPPAEGAAVDGVEPVLGALVAGEVVLLGGAVVLELLLEVLLGGVVVVVVAA